MSLNWDALEKLVFAADCIEEERIGCQRLRTILGAEAEENDVAFAHGHRHERGLTLNPIAAQQPA